MFKRLLLFSTLSLFSTLQAQTLVTAFTSEGNFELEIYDNIVPITAGNFLDLVNDKFYDGIIFHRVIDNFMIQGGDPTGTGTGGPGYSIEDEFHTDMRNIKKTISMANSGPNTGGSQFFINLVNNNYLDYDQTPLSSKHPVFGKVTQNFHVIETIGSVSTDGNDRPLTDVVIDSIRVGSLALLNIEQNEISNKISLAPNPITSDSKIILNSETDENCEINIIDKTGRLLFKTSINLLQGENNIRLESILKENLEAGYYLMQLNSNKSQRSSIPFVVK